MTTETKRLVKLLEDGKITESDFQNLSAALSQKKSPGLWTWLLNPFQFVDGPKALGIGLVGLLIMSLLALLGHAHFPGAMSLQATNHSSADSAFQIFAFLAFQQAAAIFVLGSFFFFFSKLLKQKNLRYIDFIGSVALGRLAFLPATLFFWILTLIHQESLAVTLGSPDSLPPLTLALVAIIGILSLAWLLTTYFHAYKESSGLRGRSLWTTYILGLVLTETIFFFAIRPLG